DHRVQHTLHALVLEGTAAQHRLDFASDGTGTQGLDDLFFGEVALFEVFVHQLFGRLGGRFDELLAPFVGRILELGRDIAVLELDALRGVVPQDGFQLDEVYHALEGVFGTHGDDDGHGIGAQAGLQLVVDLEEVGAGAVHLVDEGQTRHAI